MVFLRADREDLDGYTAGMVRAALEDCARADLLCVMELMTYRLDDESPEAFAARKEDLVVDGAVFLQECGTKVLKLEYPGSASGCRRITDAIDVPWAVLSAGVDHEAFCGQLRDAMDGGADGFIAGRSLWKEAVGRPAAERRAFLDGVARAAWRSCWRSSTPRGSGAAAAPRHRRRHDVLQGARARRGRARSSARPARGRRGPRCRPGPSSIRT